MLRKLSKCLLASVLACSGIIPINHVTIKANSREETKVTDYKLYPKPQSMTYLSGNYILEEGIHVIYDQGIDEYTKQRLQEVASLKKLNVSASDKEEAGKTNIYIGIYGSKGTADTYIENTYRVGGELFEKTDSYYMKSDNGTISILGKDSDASFYALTTLYQIFGQMESFSIRNFEIKDYADVKSRGFIEGYYGNPWSLEDRIDLMKFGGYYKMNSYFYAPKDDPKHNAKWRELYTEDELQNIKALADAGNASKCRFVFALHPFMNSPMRFDSEENYQKDLKILKDKFKQVIDNGVREIAILDDDAAVPGGNPNNAVRVLKDMTNWLKEVQKEYPDMKLTLPYVPSDYGGWGTSNELQTLKNAPDNVQIVMTGGKVWGEVSKNFTDTYYNNMGSGPFMWINWPCTDNSKKHLIMGGNSTFLHPGVDANKIKGIMLNPMQQSEPSKVAIFANAAYAWNIWDTNEEADQAWEDSFSFVDHNTAIETEGSKALRELSKHMINQNMDGRVAPLQESVELKKLLTPYKEKLKNGTVTAEETDALIHEFEILQKAAKTYRNNTGNTRTRDQIVYWLNSWDDTTQAAIAYLKGIKASLLNDTSSVMRYTSEGQQAFEKSKTYGYHYVDHTEYAEVGVQHIVPFINETGKYLNNYVKSVVDPNAVTNTFITNRTDTPTGDLNNVFDGDDSTGIIYKTPAAIKQDDYVGVMFSKAIDVHKIRFLLGSGKDHFDQARLEYTTDGKTWQNVSDATYDGVTNQPQEVVVDNLSLHAKGIRLIATKNNKLDAWLEIREVKINPKEKVDDKYYASTVTTNGLSVQSGKGINNITDGNKTTEAWFAKGPYEGGDRDKIGVDATVTLTFDAIKPIGSIYVAQGTSAAGDVLNDAALEYQNADGAWVELGSMNNSKEQTVDVSSQNISAKAIRIRNKKLTNGWWRLAEVQVFAPKEIDKSKYVYTNTDAVLTSAIEGNRISLGSSNVTLKPSQYVGIKLENIREITSVDVSDIPQGGVLQTSINGLVWTSYDASKETNARYIRVINNSNADINMNMQTFAVTIYELAVPKLLECTTPIAPGWGEGEDMRPLKNDANIFDNNLATGAEIGGLPQKGQYAIFDLGQTRTFHTFRYYVVETQYNYLRDGIFEVADSPTAPADEWKPLLEVGDGIENTGSEDANRKAKDYTEFTHDSKNPGNMYKEAKNLDVKGRYIRLRFTATNNNRAVYFNELQINNGEYVSVEANRDVIAQNVEEPGKIPSNMFDGDISTVYKSSAKNSSFTYYLSDPANVKTIRFAQNGEVSNATVTAEVLDTTTRSAGRNSTIIKLGKLNQSLTEFIVPAGKTLLNVKVEWSDKIPEISEIITTDRVQPIVNKDALKAEIDNPADKNWTKDTAAAYEEALTVAQEIFDNDYASQDSVDMAVGALKAARADTKIKADITELKSLVDKQKKQYDNDVEIYSSGSYAGYALAIADGERALEDADNVSDVEAAQFVSAIQTADAALVYSAIQAELAEVTLQNDKDKYAKESYSTVTYNSYTSEVNKLDAIVKKDKTQRVNPKEIYEVRTSYNQNKNELADITKLKALISDFDNYNKDLYEVKSFEAYEKVILASKDLLSNGTVDSVKKSEQEIAEKAAALVYKSTAALSEVINELEKINKDDYTKVTYQALRSILDDAKRDLSLNDDTLNKAYIQRLGNARSQLIDVRSYKAVLAKAKQYEVSDYTKDTFKKLEKALENSKELLEKGSEKELSAASENIQKAIEELQPLAKGLKDYQDSMKLKDAKLYTKESFAIYQEQFNILKNLPYDNTSISEFQKARDAFEKAQQLLVLKEADYEAVEKALAKVPSQMSLYTSSSVKTLNDAIDAVRYGLKADEQDKVDMFAKNINNAIKALVYKTADYSKVQDVLKKVPSNTAIYTDASVKRLKDAIKAIDYGKNILEQNQVDAYAKAVENALNSLVLKTGNGSGSHNNSGNGGQNGTGNSTGSNQGNVNTFDNTNVTGLLTITVLAGLAVLILVNKRRVAKK